MQPIEPAETTAGDPDDVFDMVTERLARPEGAWEEAIFTKSGVLLAAWALDGGTGESPAYYELRWGEKTYRMADLIPRPDVGRIFSCDPPLCGLRYKQLFNFDDIPDNAAAELPKLVAVWAGGMELSLKPPNRLKSNQFQFLSFTAHPEFVEFFQNPAFRVANPAIIAWASRRMMELAPDNAMSFMSAFCVMIYRHLENGYFSTGEILEFAKKWERLYGAMFQPVRGERYRWVISVKLALGYFFLTQKNELEARRNFVDISGMEEQIPSWPQASTNILIGVFMAAWLDNRAGDNEAALGRLARSYDILKAGVNYLPVWSKHHFSELENSLRIARECFAFQKILEGETRDHILPANSKLSFRMISVVLSDLINRGRFEDGPFPARGDFPPSAALRP
jgi:hypothetical protein